MSTWAYYLNIFYFTIYGHGGHFGQVTLINIIFLCCFFSTEQYYTPYEIISSNSQVISEKGLWLSKKEWHWMKRQRDLWCSLIRFNISYKFYDFHLNS